MKSQSRILAFAMVLIALAVVAWFLLSPLFLSQSVDEAFPFELPDMEAASAMEPAEVEAALNDAMAEIDEEFVAALPEATAEALETKIMELSAVMPDHEMEEEMPDDADAWVVSAEGTFQDADNFHRGSGTAKVYQLGEERVLRLEDFNVTNGPDLHVLLVENIEGGRDEMGEYVDLGQLKGNMGNQNYEIPDGVDIEAFGGVMIYCMPFHVVFSTAPFGG